MELLLYLAGKITSIHGEFTRDSEGRVRQYVLSGTADGVVFSLQNSTLCTLDNCARIYTTEGSLTLPNYWKADSLTIQGNGEIPLSYPCPHELVYEIRHFAECIEQGLCESPVMTEALSVAGIEALERAFANATETERA